ncbi:hypothetical protein BpHYR1_054296 [Brachionus plicatilis]|uniref:Uncharacterized protein n=1 Tax=Brachionus plicatilis TaxID=10195 RepID=A0A3M7QTY7_BRAPC|nr:hypothetical protein BpHYR1_054296 [Brachionus plicatilis]
MPVMYCWRQRRRQIFCSYLARATTVCLYRKESKEFSLNTSVWFGQFVGKHLAYGNVVSKACRKSEAVFFAEMLGGRVVDKNHGACGSVRVPKRVVIAHKKLQDQTFAATRLTQPSLHSTLTT